MLGGDAADEQLSRRLHPELIAFPPRNGVLGDSELFSEPPLGPAEPFADRSELSAIHTLRIDGSSSRVNRLGTE